MKKLFLLIFVGLAMLFGCSKSDKNYSIEKKDGLIYVHNFKTKLSDIKLVMDMKIDDSEGQFYQIDMIKEDKSGKIYILDGKSDCIKVFSNNGKFIRNIGTKGKGPAEFIRPTAFDFLKSGNLIVCDSGNMRFQVFDNNGKFVNSFKLNLQMPDLFLIDNQDNYVCGANNFSFKKSDKAQPLFIIFDKDLKKINEIGQKKVYPDNFKTYIMNSNRFAIFDDLLFVAFSAENKIIIFKNYKTERLVDRKLLFEPRKPDIGAKFSNGSVSLSASYDKISYDVSVDSNGNFYVLTNASSNQKQKKKVIEIYNKEGILLKIVPIDNIDPTRIFVGKDNKIYLNDEDNMTVYRYKSIL